VTERTVVHVLRHGEVHNPDGVLYGRLPGYQLSALGEQMAKAVAASLAGRPIRYVAASSLERAQQTAAPMADQFELPVVTDDRLIEAENQFEGLRVGVGDGVWRHPRYWHTLRNPLRPSWGEPYAAVAARMAAAAAVARDAARGAEAVVVSHQLPIWTLRRFVEGRRLWHDPRHRECALASLTSIAFDNDEIAEVRYSEPAADLIARSANAEERGA
jgi:broad specificity phosphatase PhoE